MKLYKFYKNGCPPCYAVSRILNNISIPPDIEIENVNTELEENKELLEKYGIKEVPVLQFENGRKIVGMNSKTVIEKFLQLEA